MARPSDPKAKSRLLEAAERVFIERGLDRAKVEDITRAAGLSKGAFYLHFKTKDDAFKEILAARPTTTT
jgi:AcrR family transcriptional regulator